LIGGFYETAFFHRKQNRRLPQALQYSLAGKKIFQEQHLQTVEDFDQIFFLSQ